jgi:hypothetical protein
MIGKVSEQFLFYASSEFQGVPSNQKWAFFSTGIIFNDLIKQQQGLIHNYIPVQRKLVNYFV